MKSELEHVPWPPDPIKTDRLELRQTEPRDRTAMIELLASPEVGRYLGGAQSRDALERDLPEIPGRRAGVFAVELDGDFIGTVTLDQRDPDDQVRPDLAQVELGYLFLPSSWGHGYAAEACSAALNWFTSARPGEPVVLVTQTANAPSLALAQKLHFTEAAHYEAWGATQWLGVWTPPQSA
ncbi:GNAT family N-acetyltransferase [Kribbella jejuensis]|uniref:RimJ/RimL family protein N-acetyltransferase n=1 Tax=Kribbella jejuensis TaxID=236068 RepID=A0A542ETA3_9ACTN|nr:GNAT family N-acetyltransferase [Kribbella jejuensis]TQJ18454.1 RimJ/RimL family protein N-acetyltransferase [Kribbella jejuensis]